MNAALRIISLGVVFISAISALAQTVMLSPTTLSFGNVAINSTSKVERVTMTNTGTVTVDISSITTDGDFAISANACGSTLKAGKDCSISITFTPTVLGALSGTLTVDDNASNTPQTVALSGTGIAQATATPSSLGFGAAVGHMSVPPQVVTLKNNLPTTLTGTSWSLTGPFNVFTDKSHLTTCTTTLDAHKACSIWLVFTPVQVGTVTGSLTITDSASNSPQIVSLSGTGTGQATLLPSSLAFNVTEVGNSNGPKNATLYARDGDILGISYSTKAPFAIYSSTCPTNLDSPGDCIIRVTFTPTQSGIATGTLSVSDSDGTQTVSLTGTGTIEDVYTSVTSVDFGNQSVGTTSRPVSVDLFNEGSTQITVTSVSTTGDFAITDNYCMDGVKPNSHCYIEVVFSPTQSGPLTGTLSFVDNASGSPQTVSLSGLGD